MYEVGENNEFRALKLRTEYLKGRCAEEIESYMALVAVGGDNIRMRYMLALGGLEHLACEFRITVLRWRRRLELCREAEAKGERPDLVAIEERVTAELAQYQEELNERRALVKEMRARQNMALLSEDEVTAIRHGYLSAAKKLHPDLAPGLPKEAMVLWQRIQDSYHEKDWAELKFLLGLVDGVLSGKSGLVALAGGLEGLKAEVGRLEKKLSDLVSKRQNLLKQKPYCWKALLDDADEVSRRRDALEQQIEGYRDEVADCEAMWQTMRAA